MSVLFAQSPTASVNSANTGGATSLTTNWNATPTAGNMLVAAIAWDDSSGSSLTVTSVGGTGTDTFTLVHKFPGDGVSYAPMSFYYCASCGAGRTGVELTNSVGTPFAEMSLWEVSGLTSPVADVIFTGGPVTGATSISGTTPSLSTSAEAAVLAAQNSANYDFPNAFSAGTWTNDYTSIAFSGNAYGHQVTSSTTGLAATLTSKSANMQFGVVTFRAGGGVATPPFIPNPDSNASVVASARAKAVAVALTAGLVWAPFAPTTPSNTKPAGWYQPLGVAPAVAKAIQPPAALPLGPLQSAPSGWQSIASTAPAVAVAQPGYAFVPFNTVQPAPPVPYGWLSTSSFAPPLVAPQPGSSFVPFNTRQTNTATIDKWQQPLSIPVLAPAVKLGSTFVPFNTAQFIATPPWGWYQSLSTAPPITAPQSGNFFVPFNTTQFFPPPAWGWHQPLPATPRAAQAIQSQPNWTTSAFQTFTLAWQQQLAATPSRSAAQQGSLSLSFVIAPIINTVVGMPWQQSLSTAVKSPAAVQSNSFVPFDTVQIIPPPSAVDTHDGVWTKRQITEYRRRQRELAREQDKLLSEGEARRKKIARDIREAAKPIAKPVLEPGKPIIVDKLEPVYAKITANMVPGVFGAIVLKPSLIDDHDEEDEIMMILGEIL